VLIDVTEASVHIEPSLLEILACPNCHSPLRVDDTANELVCINSACGLAYPVRDDIPVLLIDEARRPEDHSGGSSPAGEAADSGPA
jgi:hypothetical protein